MRLSSLGRWLLLLVPLVAVVLLIFWFTGTAFPFTGSPAASAPVARGIGEGELTQELLGAPYTFSRDMIGWKYTFTAKYRYTILAKIVGIQEYAENSGDQITPMDLAIAYGDVIRPEYLQYFTFRMGDRQLSTTVEYPKYISMLPDEYWFSHVTNNHLVFADAAGRAAAFNSTPGECIGIQEYLIDISGRGPNGETYTRTTSISRTDEYPAGCEVVYVESFRTLPC